MKKILLIISCLFIIPLSGAARMFPKDVPIPSICWDSWEEAVSYHKDILNEYPIGRGVIINPNGPTFGTITINPIKPSWTYLHFHRDAVTGKQVVCAIASGSTWEVIVPDFGEEEKLKL
jgi:hypothetical protein